MKRAKSASRSSQLPAIVVDASAAVDLILRGASAPAVEDAVSGADLVAPDIIVLEVLSTLRRLERRVEITSARAGEALADFRNMPLRRWPTDPLLEDIWAMRMNVGVYDACYVALALALRCPLVTVDARLSRVQGLRATIILASGGARLG